MLPKLAARALVRGTWSPSGQIVFAPDVIMAGLSQVAAGGGTPRATTVLNVAQGDNSHWWPLFLPDRVHFLYLVRSTDDARRGVYLGRIDRSPSESDAFLFRSSSEAVYASMPGGSDGVLFYSVDGRIEVRRFNARSLAVSPDARAIDISAGNGTLFHPLMLSASSDVLAFAQSAPPFGDRLESVDRDGQRHRLWDEAEAQNWPRVSPDGRYLARQRIDDRNNPDIWVEDLERGTQVRVTTAIESDIQPGMCGPWPWTMGPHGRCSPARRPNATHDFAGRTLARLYIRGVRSLGGFGSGCFRVTQTIRDFRRGRRAACLAPRRKGAVLRGSAGTPANRVGPMDRRGVPQFGSSSELPLSPIGVGHWGTQYDISPDGRRIYVLHPNEAQPPREIHVVIGWRALVM